MRFCVPLPPFFHEWIKRRGDFWSSTYLLWQEVDAKNNDSFTIILIKMLDSFPLIYQTRQPISILKENEFPDVINHTHEIQL